MWSPGVWYLIVSIPDLCLLTCLYLVMETVAFYSCYSVMIALLFNYFTGHLIIEYIGEVLFLSYIMDKI